jgi:hypothetical protein
VLFRSLSSLEEGGQHICSKIKERFRNYSLLNTNEISEQDIYTYNIMSCAIFIVIGIISENFKKVDYKYNLVIKGGKGLQISFEEFLFKYNYGSDDIDVLLLDRSQGNNYDEKLMISSEICNLTRWIIESASVSNPIFRNISVKLAIPQPLNRYSSKYVSKITYVNGPLRKVISEIDIKPLEEVDPTESHQLSSINFPLGMNFYYGQGFLILNEFQIDSFSLAYFYQNIGLALQEKIYIYTKYFLLKQLYIKLKALDKATPEFRNGDFDVSNCNRFLKKFQKSINAIFYYLYTRYNNSHSNNPDLKGNSELQKQFEIYKKLQDLYRVKNQINNLEKQKQSRTLSKEEMTKIRSKTQVEEDIKKTKELERPFYEQYSKHVFHHHLFIGFDSIDYSELTTDLFENVFDSVINDNYEEYLPGAKASATSLI